MKRISTAQNILQNFCSLTEQEFEELSKAFRGLGENADAIAALKQAIRINPLKAELHCVFSRIYTQTQRKAEAAAELKIYQRARALANFAYG